MPLWRVVSAVAALSLMDVATCRSPGDAGKEPTHEQPAKDVELPGLDTSPLTTRERREWSAHVSELLAPCPDQPVSLAQCVKESRPCSTCLPAAKFLMEQVRRGKHRSQAEAAFRIRFAPDQKRPIDVGDSPSKGPANAAVTMVEWADFECPFCAAARFVLDGTLERYAGHVRLVFKHYPLSSHEHSEGAARAAVAAARQGKFWEMHHVLFEHQGEGLDRKTIDRLAKTLGLDMKQFAVDADSEAVADAVSRDRKQAEKLGLTGTPMLWINGRYFDLESFDLSEDLDAWLTFEIEQVTGRRVEPRPAQASSGSPAAAPPANGSAIPRASGSTAPPGSAASRSSKPSVPTPRAAPAPSAGR